MAASLFERARAKGHAAACNNLALCYEEGRGVPEQDLERARALYEEAAAGGIVGAHSGAGYLALMQGQLRARRAAVYTPSTTFHHHI